MIICDSNQRKYKLTVTPPDETEIIDYDIYLPNMTVSAYHGKTRYFGGNFELDLSDWVEACWNDPNFPSSGTIQIDFVYDESTTVVVKTMSYDKELISMTQPSTGNAYIDLYNSDFKLTNVSNDHIRIPLLYENDILKGKVNNNIDKTVFMDKYGNVHNSTSDNWYEIECYFEIPPVITKSDVVYQQIMGAFQSARESTLYLTNSVKISGMKCGSSTTLPCHIKDIEKVTTYSRYNTTNNVPVYKITLEIYR